MCLEAVDQFLQLLCGRTVLETASNPLLHAVLCLEWQYVRNDIPLYLYLDLNCALSSCRMMIMVVFPSQWAMKADIIGIYEVFITEPITQ